MPKKRDPINAIPIAFSTAIIVFSTPEAVATFSTLAREIIILIVTFTLIGYIFDYLHGLHFAA